MFENLPLVYQSSGESSIPHKSSGTFERKREGIIREPFEVEPVPRRDPRKAIIPCRIGAGSSKQGKRGYASHVFGGEDKLRRTVIAAQSRVVKENHFTPGFPSLTRRE